MKMVFSTKKRATPIQVAPQTLQNTIHLPSSQLPSTIVSGNNQYVPMRMGMIDRLQSASKCSSCGDK